MLSLFTAVCSDASKATGQLFIVALDSLDGKKNLFQCAFLFLTIYCRKNYSPKVCAAKNGSVNELKPIFVPSEVPRYFYFSL